MLRTPYQLLSHIYYHFLQIVGGLVTLVGVFLIRLVPVAICIWIVESLGPRYEWFILIFGSILGIAFIGWPVGRSVAMAGIKLTDFSEKYKYGYLRLLGPDYKKPRYNDFGFTEEQYYAYNRRFSLDVIGTIFSWGAALGTMYWYGTMFPEKGFIPMLAAAGLAGSAGGGTYLIFHLLDNALASRYPQHKGVRQYNKAKRIYDAIQTEERHRRIKFESDAKEAARNVNRTKWQKIKAVIWDD